MQNSKNITAYEAINNFKSFCNFVAQRYDIQILTMDSFTGQASKNVIYVPNFEGMSPEQIEFIFSTVLHEIGHIMHTDFSEEYFSKLLNNFMATIANVLEDCRSESLLCAEFLGAKDIFLKSTIQILERNPQIFAMLTNEEKSEINFFECFSNWLYIHSHSAIFSADLEAMAWANMPEKIALEVKDFLKKSDFIKKFGDLRKKIVTQNDVLKFSEQIHDEIIKVFSVPNQPYFSFNSFRDLKALAQQKTIQIREKLDAIQIAEQAHNIEILKMEMDALSVKNNILLENKKNESLIDVNEKTLKDKQNLVGKAYKLIAVDYNIKANKEESVDHNEIISGKEEQNSEIKNKKSELKSQWKSLSQELATLEITPKNEKKITRLNSKIEKIKERIVKLETRQDKINTSIDKVGEKIEREKIAAAKSKVQQKTLLKEMSFLKGKPVEEIQIYIDQNNSEIDGISTELLEFNKTRAKYMVPHDIIQSKIFFKKLFFNAQVFQFRKEMTDSFKKLNSHFIQMGMAFSMFPRLSLSIEWKEMAQQQILADEQFMKDDEVIVIDGKPFGETTQELETILDMVQENLEFLDPALEYKKQFAPCLKDNLLSMQFMQAWIANDKDESNIIAIKHSVGSTEFDETKHENKISTINLQEMQMLFKKHEDKMNEITDCLSDSLKPKKRDRWENNKDSGDIDSESLSQFAINKNTNIFEESFSEIRENSGATIMIDMSYSSFKNEHNENDIKIIAKAISDALDNCSIAHEIVGFYAEVEPELFKEKQNFTKNRKIHGLKTVVFKNLNSSNTDALANFKFQLADNSDGESLRIAVKRLESNGFDRKIVFMLSDFLPFLTNGNTELLRKDFKQAVGFAKKNQANIYGFNLHKETEISQEFPIFTIDGVSTKNVQEIDDDGIFDFLESIK